MSAFGHVEDARLRRFLSHYLALRNGRRVPYRNQISPLDFPDLLGIVFLYEFDAASQDFYIRLAGEQIAQMLRTARAGAKLSEVFPADVFPIVLERYRRICLTPCVMHNIGRVFRYLGGTGTGERIAMPLLGEDGEPGYFLGATTYSLANDHDPEDDDTPVRITYTPL
jgi:hypothetical protein